MLHLLLCLFWVALGAEPVPAASPQPGAGVAAEAFGAPFEMNRYTTSRGVFRLGQGVLLIGAATATGGGIAMFTCEDWLFGDCPGESAFAIGLLATLGGMAASTGGALANALVLRKGGLRVPVGLGVASVAAPIVLIATGIAISGGWATVSAFIGAFVAAEAFSVAQMAANGRVASHWLPRRQPLSVLPAPIGKAPGVALAARW